MPNQHSQQTSHHPTTIGQHLKRVSVVSGVTVFTTFLLFALYTFLSPITSTTVFAQSDNDPYPSLPNGYYYQDAIVTSAVINPGQTSGGSSGSCTIVGNGVDCTGTMDNGGGDPYWAALGFILTVQRPDDLNIVGMAIYVESAYSSLGHSWVRPGIFGENPGNPPGGSSPDAIYAEESYFV